MLINVWSNLLGGLVSEMSIILLFRISKKDLVYFVVFETGVSIKFVADKLIGNDDTIN